MDPRKQSARRGGDALSMVDPAYDLRILNAIARETAIAPEPNSGEREGGRERVYSTCRLLVRNGTSIFHADRCDVRFIVNTFRATTSNRHSLLARVRVSRLPMLRVDFTGGRRRRRRRLVGDFVYNNLGITSVVNRFVVNVALGYIDVNASAGLKNVFKVLCSECKRDISKIRDRGVISLLSLLDAIILLRACS